MRELLERLEEAVKPVELVNVQNGEVLAVPNDKALKAVVKVTRSRIKLHKDGYYTAGHSEFSKIYDEFFKRYRETVDNPRGKRSREIRFLGVSRSVMKKYGNAKLERFMEDHKDVAYKFVKDKYDPDDFSFEAYLESVSERLADEVIDKEGKKIDRYMYYAGIDRTELQQDLAERMWAYAAEKLRLGI